MDINSAQTDRVADLAHQGASWCPPACARADYDPGTNALCA